MKSFQSVDFKFNFLSKDFGDLTFIPDWRGSLRPFEEQKVVLRFKPSVTGKIHQHLKLSPYMGSTR